MMTFLHHLKTKGFEVKYLKCDNAGENKTLMQVLKKWENRDLFPNIEFEYTASNTPQQNAKVERKFPTLYGCMRAMMFNAGLTKSLREKLWTECAQTATLLDNITVNEKKLSNQGILGHNCPHTIKGLRQFGEIGMIANRKNMQNNLAERGFPGILLGYCEQHAAFVYCMLNLKTEKIVITRDIVWLNKSWGHWKFILKMNGLMMNVNMVIQSILQ